MDKKFASYFWFSLFGSLLSAVLVTWLAPRVITWYFKPPAAMDFSCEAPIEWALQRLRLAQIWGLGIGALAGLVLCFAFRRRRTPPPTQVTLVK